ncbi:MAG: acyltransferase 3 [Mucilaginibacter sp.]|nr:acyltransferase 3 [Mucilaginibacter sp.]
MISNKTNVIAIDIARAIAAMGVFFYHQNIGNILARYTKLELFNSIDAFGAIYAVPLFFLISGYCIHLSNLKYIQLNKHLPLIEYYKRRLFRIYPAYLVAIVIAVIVRMIIRHRPMPSFSNLLVHLLCLQGFILKYFFYINLVFWTISVEMAFYIIYPLFYFIRLKRSLNSALVFAFFISTICIFYFWLQKNVSIAQYYWFGNIWFAWCSGAFIADKLFFDPKAFNKPVFKVIYILIASLFIGGLFLNVSYLPGIGLVWYQLKILIWTGPLIYLLSKEHWFKKQESLLLKVIVCIGLSSYSLYLLHVPLILFKNYLVYAFLPPEFQLAGLILGVIMIPFIAWFSYCLIEKPFIIKKAVAKN